MIFQYNDCANLGGIYKITNIESNKVYIGESCRFKKRWAEHMRSLLKGTVAKNQTATNKHFQNSFNKSYELLGHHDFLIFEIVEVMSGSTATQREKREEEIINETITKLGRDCVYNIVLHPTQQQNRKSYTHLTETRKKIAEAIKKSWTRQEYRDKIIRKGFKASEEAKKKMSLAKKGKIPWNKGKTGYMSEDQRQKLSAAAKKRIPTNKGKKYPPKIIEKFKQAHGKGKDNPLYGKALSKEHRQKLSIAKKNKPNKYAAGIPRSEETKQKIKEKLLESWKRRKEQKLAELVYKAKDKQETDEVPSSSQLFERIKKNIR